MLKVYCLLIRKWMDELQENIYDMSNDDISEYVQKHIKYTSNMDKLYKRLNKYYGFNKDKFYALQDQAVMF